jgi:hypothetical protein
LDQGRLDSLSCEDAGQLPVVVANPDSTRFRTAWCHIRHAGLIVSWLHGARTLHSNFAKGTDALRHNIFNALFLGEISLFKKI